MFFIILACVTAGCKDDAKNNGAIRVVLDTDVVIPKDIDRIEVQVTRRGQTLLTQRLDLSTDHKLPSDILLRFAREGGTPLQIRVIAYANGHARILRDAVTTIPAENTYALPLPLVWLCDGSVTDGNGVVEAACPEGFTCIDGACASAQVAAKQLIPATDATIKEIETTFGPCFDVVTCFSDAQEADVRLFDCSIPTPAGATRSTLNIAAKLPLGSVGSCDGNACYVTLERDGAKGWSPTDGALGERIILPPGLCERATSGRPFAVITTLNCPTKEGRRIICDPSGIGTNSGASDNGVGRVCAGDAIEDCGTKCGKHKRTCVNGTWSEFAACTDEGVCENGAVQPCPTGKGTQTCAGCQWGKCIDPTCDGEALTEPCPGAHCGTHDRTCSADGVLSTFGACKPNGACTPGIDTQPCEGGGKRLCQGDCSFGACVPPVPPPKCVGSSMSTDGCEMCGSKTRDCVDGKWTDYGTCKSKPDACTPGTTRTCGAGGKQKCGGTCTWDECVLPECTTGADEGCGLCGSRHRDCINGKYGAWGACTNSGECAYGTARTCNGGAGTQYCSGDCHWLGCSAPPVVCTGPPPTQSCGLCGTQARTCNFANGTWTGDWGTCTGQGTCTANAATACTTGTGDPGTQTCSAACQPGTCNSSVHPCTGTAPTASCGNCGTKTQTCDTTTGTWTGGFGACVGSGACAANTVSACPGGTTTCSSTCAPGPCVPTPTCAGTAPTQTCGNCGTQMQTCDAMTGTWTGGFGACTGEGVCHPGDRVSCPGGGLATCTSTCQAGACSPPVTSCPAPAPTRPCQTCGTKTAVCDPDTKTYLTDETSWSFTACIELCACGTGGAGYAACDSSCHPIGECNCLGAPPTQGCGKCGTQSRACDPTNGTFSGAWGECTNEGSCSPGDIVACPGGGEATCTADCRPGPCELSPCAGAPPTEACGNCGTRSRTCDPHSGTWSGGFTECLGQGECAAGQVAAVCGSAATSSSIGYQICTSSCEIPETCSTCPGECAGGDLDRTACGPDGYRQCLSLACAWTGCFCDGQFEQPCACTRGGNGLQTRECTANGTKWGEWSACGQCEFFVDMSPTTPVANKAVAPVIDQAHNKLLAVTLRNGLPGLYRCNLDDADGSSCVFQDLSTGVSPVKNTAVAFANNRLLVVLEDNTTSKLSALNCSFDGTNCTLLDISAGQPMNSGQNPVALVGEKNGSNSLLVVAHRSSSTGNGAPTPGAHGPVALFSCRLSDLLAGDSSTCEYDDISDNYGGVAATPQVAFDEERDRLFVAVGEDAGTGSPYPTVIDCSLVDGVDCRAAPVFIPALAESTWSSPYVVPVFDATRRELTLIRDAGDGNAEFFHCLEDSDECEYTKDAQGYAPVIAGLFTAAIHEPTSRLLIASYLKETVDIDPGEGHTFVDRYTVGLVDCGELPLDFTKLNCSFTTISGAEAAGAGNRPELVLDYTNKASLIVTATAAGHAAFWGKSF